MRFDSYHPVINLIYFAAAIVCTIWFHHPVFLGISYVCAFVYSVKLNGKRAVIFNLCLIPLIFLYAVWYSYYNHFGVTNLRQNFIGNQITLESVVYGIVRGTTVAAVIMFFSCVFAVVSSDKVVYLFGRISPRLSLFLSILLRCVPRVKERARKIEISREGIGKGVRQGNILERFLHGLSLISIVITWTLEDFVESTVSMKSRGYSLRGRTAFSIYRFDNRDRSFVVMIFLCLTFVASAILLDQTEIYYNPEIIMNPVTPMSFVFYVAYAVLLLLPMGLQIAGEIRYKRKK